MRRLGSGSCFVADSKASSGPGNGGDVIYRYRLYAADGSDAGEAHYAVLIQPGETIHATGGQRENRPSA